MTLKSTEHILNLDAVMPPPRYVILDGKKHEILPMTLEQYAYSQVLHERLRDIASGIGTQEDIELVYSAIHSSIPTISIERLRKLHMPALFMLLGEIEEAAGDVQAIVNEHKNDEAGEAEATPDPE